MPKASKIKYYAVRKGRQGPHIYSTWDECSKNVIRWPGAVHRSFPTRTQAEDWLASAPQLTPMVSQTESEPSPIVALPSESTGVSLRSEQFPSTELRQDAHLQRLKDGATATDVVLSPEQQKVLEMVRTGKNVFFTGSAGTGKSVLLREIIRTLGGSASSRLGITASTGIASVNIGGTTLHSWAGIGLGQEPAKNYAGKFLAQSKFEPVLRRWRQVKTLIMDEISMIDGLLFDTLEEIGRRVRQNESPFGGIQLVLCGDFCQLPPVSGRVNGVQVPAIFAFEARAWDRCVGNPIILSQVFRQKDQGFVDMLNGMRFGNLDEKTVKAFKQLSRPLHYSDGIEPTELFATRAEVAHANSTRLAQLDGIPQTYEAANWPGYDSNGQRISAKQMEKLLERLIATPSITLKVGAQVMLIKNLVQGRLVNGSVGQVVAFSTSIDALRNHMEIAKVEGTKDKTSQEDDRAVWPVVQFTNGARMLCIPASFTVNNALGQIEAEREQIPLILAWALSIHKSQGQTLERVRVDLGRVFEKGQAYVALSRATSMDTLQVLHFDPLRVVAHPRVLEWHNRIEDEKIFARQEYGSDDEIDNY